MKKLATDKASLFDTLSTCFAHMAQQERLLSKSKRRASNILAALERHEPKMKKGKDYNTLRNEEDDEASST